MVAGFIVGDRLTDGLLTVNAVEALHRPAFGVHFPNRSVDHLDLRKALNPGGRLCKFGKHHLTDQHKHFKIKDI